MLANVSWRQVLNVLGVEGLKVLGKTCKELICLWVEDDDVVGYISHSGVLLFHKVVQICDIWPYIPMISQCCTCYGGARLFAPHKLPYYDWRRGQKICRFVDGWWCEVITKRLCEPNSILPLPTTRNTNKLGTGSYWQVWVQFQVVAFRYHRGKWCGFC
jgi:hypothetical protein